MEEKILVAYFSASGMTAEVAKEIAEASGADLYVINLSKPTNKTKFLYQGIEKAPPLESRFQ